ncbi:MAG: hypothetical protein NTV51_03710 [Verrucomicrobia bacterium]|nr:hypothetical protein [Verrucomicrobiota bacterium]
MKMTRDSLQKLVGEYRREGRWNAVFFFTLFFGVIIGDSISTPGSEPARFFAWAFFPVMLGLFPAMLVYSLLRIRIKGLVCPRCRARLIGELGEQAIASGRCWKCGDGVFDGEK